MHLALVGPLGRRFARAIGERSSAAVFAWTVNDEYWMRWCVSTGRVDGVVTDDPRAMGEVCRRWAAGERGGKGKGVRRGVGVVVAQVLMMVLAVVFWGRLRGGRGRKKR